MEHNWPVFGHDWAVDYLRKGMFHGRVRHAYLIAGTSSIGKNTLAHAFALALNCQSDDLLARPCGVCRDCKKIISGNHSDMLYAENDATSGALKIEAIRAITGRIAMKPYEGRYRVAIFDGFDRAQPRAQDALLKTLEEPPPHAVLILLASSLESILSTITSRSQVIHLRPVAAHIIRETLMREYGTPDDTATLLARVSGGRIGWAIQAAQNPDMLDQRTAALDLLEEAAESNRSGRFELAADLSKDKAALAPLLELWLTYWRDVLLYLEGNTDQICNIDRRDHVGRLAMGVTSAEVVAALRATELALGDLSYNLNLRLALEVMFLDYPGLR